MLSSSDLLMPPLLLMLYAIYWFADIVTPLR